MVDKRATREDQLYSVIRKHNRLILKKLMLSEQDDLEKVYNALNKNNIEDIKTKTNHKKPIESIIVFCLSNGEQIILHNYRESLNIYEEWLNKQLGDTEKEEDKNIKPWQKWFLNELLPTLAPGKYNMNFIRQEIKQNTSLVYAPNVVKFCDFLSSLPNVKVHLSADTANKHYIEILNKSK